MAWLKLLAGVDNKRSHLREISSQTIVWHCLQCVNICGEVLLEVHFSGQALNEDEDIHNNIQNKAKVQNHNQPGLSLGIRKSSINTSKYQPVFKFFSSSSMLGQKVTCWANFNNNQTYNLVSSHVPIFPNGPLFNILCHNLYFSVYLFCSRKEKKVSQKSSQPFSVTNASQPTDLDS